MHPDGIKIMNLMFRPGETVCPHDNKYSYHSVPLEVAMGETVTLVSKDIDRPHRYIQTSSITLIALNPIKGFREDVNCTAYRNFLIEVDIGTMEQQINYIKRDMKVPYSALIFSGNKSVHALISLDQDLPDEETYRHVTGWIRKIMTAADRNIINPSRSIRLPGALRDTGKYQELLEYRGAITLKELREWLMKWPNLKPKPPSKEEVSDVPDFNKLKPWTQKKLIEGIDKSKGRNREWFGIAADFAVAGFSKEFTIKELGKRFVPERDFGMREWKTTINSAFKHVRRDRE